MRQFAVISLLLLACSLPACGKDEAQPEEVNVPESEAAMKETEQQREQQNLQQEQGTEIEEFDKAEQ